LRQNFVAAEEVKKTVFAVKIGVIHKLTAMEIEPKKAGKANSENFSSPKAIAKSIRLISSSISLMMTLRFWVWFE